MALLPGSLMIAARRLGHGVATAVAAVLPPSLLLGGHGADSLAVVQW